MNISLISTLALPPFHTAIVGMAPYIAKCWLNLTQPLDKPHKQHTHLPMTPMCNNTPNNTSLCIHHTWKCGWGRNGNWGMLSHKLTEHRKRWFTTLNYWLQPRNKHYRITSKQTCDTFKRVTSTHLMDITCEVN